MTYGIVREGQTWPDAGPLDLRLIMPSDDTSDPLVHRDGSAEVCIAGPSEKSNPGTLVIPIRFATINQARRAAELLAATFTLIYEIHAETLPATCETHTEWAGYLSRELKKERFCEACGAHLGTLVMGSAREWIPA